MSTLKKIIRQLLLPFSWLYGIITGSRNWLYDKDIIPSKRFDLPIIGIGNLSAGGTGKTPMAEYILQLLLQNGYHPALLSRGYKRKTKGFNIVKPFSLAEDVGDEPFQIKQKFPSIIVAVCENRVEGVGHIREFYPETDVVVLDDCLQHRSLKPGFNILLTDYNKPYFSDQLLPAGMLRESTAGRIRADIIIVTKCPEELAEAEKREFIKKLKPYPGQEIYFSHIDYMELRKVATNDIGEASFPTENLKGYEVLLVTGIANPESLQNFISKIAQSAGLVRFQDHHRFSMDDIKRIEYEFGKIQVYNKLVLTTEKDWRRLEGTAEAQALKQLPLYFLPISVKWGMEEKLRFDEKIMAYVRQNAGNG